MMSDPFSITELPKKPRITKDDWLAGLRKLHSPSAVLPKHGLKGLREIVALLDPMNMKVVLRVAVERPYCNIELDDAINAASLIEACGQRRMIPYLKEVLQERAVRVRALRRACQLPNELKLRVCEYLVDIFPTVSLAGSPQQYAARIGGSEEFQKCFAHALLDRTSLRIHQDQLQSLHDTRQWQVRHLRLKLDDIFGHITAKEEEIVRVAGLFKKLTNLTISNLMDDRTWRTFFSPAHYTHRVYDRWRSGESRMQFCVIEAEKGTLTANEIRRGLRAMKWRG